jgi:GNAT superfamily N-acetyltransferase
MELVPTLKFVSAQETHSLRLEVLKPPHEEYEYDYAGDNLETTFHMALFSSNQMVSVASFFEKKCRECESVKSIQLRGMATSRDFQGKGLGAKLVAYAIDEAKSRGYKRMWCNARLKAIPFYEKLGFVVISEAFMVPKVGLHRVMSFPL